MRRALLLSASILLAHCSSEPELMPRIEFLTREGCVQTTMMRGRLDVAIEEIGKAIPYRVIDLDSLPGTDVRKGYPTPTILVGGADLFGMPAPTPPFPDPT